tara:strand:- start:5417 stop:5695 length:279 start_codon:yes stop_codon:yes gene_type:complete
MYLLTVKNNKDEGAYAVQDSHGHKVLFLFEEEDDAERYSIMISSEEYAEELEVVEVDEELAIKTCKMYNYKYSIITPNDIVIPPNNDNLQDD